MANFIDPTRIEAAADRLTASLIEPITRCRVHRLLCDAFRCDAGCARAPSARQLAKAPPWVAERLARGESVHAFHLPNRRRTAAARMVALVRTAVAPIEPRSGVEQLFVEEQRVFISKCVRMAMADMEAAAAELAQRRAQIDQERAFSDVVHAPETIAASGARTWTIVERPIDLGLVGEALQNCLRRKSGYFAGYAQELQSKASVFWVLRERGAVVAVARVRQGTVTEFRGRANMAPRSYLKYLPRLLNAKGYGGTAELFGVRITLDARKAAWLSEDENEG